MEPNSESATALVTAGLALLGEVGLGGVTVRAVAARAGLAFPTVQHHFPTKEALLRAVFAAALAADADTAARWASAWGEGGDRRQGEQFLRSQLAWSCGTGATSTAARNAALLGIARGGGSGGALRWAARRRRQLAPLLAGAGDAGRFLLELTLGLEVLSLGCRRHPLLPLMNDEAVQRGVALFCGERVGEPAAWFQAQVLAQLQEPGETAAGRPAPARRRVLEAGARLLAERGAGQLTHRAVAAASGVAVSVVSYHFRTSEELAYAVYRFVHDQLAEFSWSQAQREGGDTGAMMRIGDAPAYLASLDAIITSAAAEQRGDFAWTMRMSRGFYYLRRATPEQGLSTTAFNVHVYSIWSAGMLLLAEACWSPRRRETLVRRRLQRAAEVFALRPDGDAPARAG